VISPSALCYLRRVVKADEGRLAASQYSTGVVLNDVGARDAVP